MPLDEWKVLPHGPLQTLAQNLWQVEGELEHIPLGRRMVLATMSDGRLLVHNAVCVSETLMTQIEALGEVAYILVPSAFHRIDAPRWAARFPRARVLCAPVARKKVLSRVRVDGDFSELPRSADLELIVLRGGEKSGEAVLRHRDAHGTTLVFNDMLMNNQPTTKSWWWKMYALTGSLGGPKVTGLMKWVGVSNKKQLAEHLLELAALPGLHTVVPGHGALIRTRAAETLRDVAHALN